MEENLKVEPVKSVKTVEKGDHVGVKLFLTAKKEEGDVVIANLYAPHESPVYFFVGEDKVIPAINDELIGMREGETKKFTASPARAYGIIDNEAKIIAKKDDFKTASGRALLIGDMVGAKDARYSQNMMGIVTEIDDKTGKVVVDLNHPHAGCEVECEITVELIEKV